MKIRIIKTALVGLVTIGPVCTLTYTYGTKFSDHVVIEDKERITETDGESRYIIFTNKGVFENTDSFWYFKFDSSDVYSKLRRGNSYTIKAYGWRIPFMSSYPNIVEVTEQGNT